MRFNKKWTLPWLGGLMLLSAACGRHGASVGVGVDMGPGVEIYGYSADRHGDWRTNYRQWAPVVVYESNGRYYPSRVRGGREVQVYRHQSRYFLPPRDRDWARKERRFHPKRMPRDDDYGRARPTR